MVISNVFLYYLRSLTKETRNMGGAKPRVLQRARKWTCDMDVFGHIFTNLVPDYSQRVLAEFDICDCCLSWPTPTLSVINLDLEYPNTGFWPHVVWNRWSFSLSLIKNRFTKMCGEWSEAPHILNLGMGRSCKKPISLLCCSEWWKFGLDTGRAAAATL